MKVLVVGATGRNAGLVVPELKRRKVTVRALAHGADRADAARQRGADEVVVADLSDPASLRSAVEGVDGVFHINPAFAPQEAAMGTAMVDAAVSAGVSKFVFSSVYHPSISSMVNHADKQPVEEALYASGMDFTVLQPAMFMQNLEGAWTTMVKTGRLTMPYSKRAKVCYVDYRDVAEAAALAFVTDTLNHGTFELCATGMVDRIDMAEIATSVLGHTVTAHEVTPEEWATTASIQDGPLLQGLVRMNEHYDKYGFAGGNSLVLHAILGREPRTLAQYFTELKNRTR